MCPKAILVFKLLMSKNVAVLCAMIIGFTAGVWQNAHAQTPASPKSPLPEDELYGVCKGMQAGNFYGNRVKNRVNDAINGVVWVNSIYVDRDQGNTVELGWFDDPNDRMFFSVRLTNYWYQQENLFSVQAGTDHNYKLYSQYVSPSGWRWVRIVDRTEYGYWSHTYGRGTVVRACMERHSLDDEANTHFWDLKYADSAGTFLPWYKMDFDHDFDPEYQPCVVSNTDFFVKRVCP